MSAQRRVMPYAGPGHSLGGRESTLDNPKYVSGTPWMIQNVIDGKEICEASS